MLEFSFVANATNPKPRLNFFYLEAQIHGKNDYVWLIQRQRIL